VKAFKAKNNKFLLLTSISQGVYALLSLMLVVGLQTKKRALALPYMILQVLANRNWLTIVAMLLGRMTFKSIFCPLDVVNYCFYSGWSCWHSCLFLP